MKKWPLLVAGCFHASASRIYNLSQQFRQSPQAEGWRFRHWCTFVLAQSVHIKSSNFSLCRVPCAKIGYTFALTESVHKTLCQNIVHICPYRKCSQNHLTCLCAMRLVPKCSALLSIPTETVYGNMYQVEYIKGNRARNFRRWLSVKFFKSDKMFKIL